MQAVGSPGRGTGRVDGRRRFVSRLISIRVVVVAGLVVSVLSVAWGFAGIDGELRLRDNGLVFNDADLALDAAAASRSHLGEALRLAAYGDALPGGDVGRIEDLALSLADDELREFDVRSGVLLKRDANPELALQVEQYLATGSALVAALRDDDLAAAESLFTAELEPGYTVLASSLSGIRAATLAAFTNSTGVNYGISLATRFLLAVAVPIGAIVVIFDAMRRRQRHRELQLQLETEREVTQSKDEFIANVSHELRTPLTIVSGFATLLEDDESLPSHAAEAAAFITREAGELTRMVEDLLTAARADAGSLAITFEQFPIHQAIESVVVADADGGRITYELEGAVAYADSFRIRQIVRNLLSNAVKHGGPDIRVTGLVQDGSYVITVADNGEGVDPEIADSVFDRFVHGPGDHLLTGSVGLGLAIVKSLSDRMGTTVGYERLPGETRFILGVPLLPAGDDTRTVGVIHLDSIGSA